MISRSSSSRLVSHLAVAVLLTRSAAIGAETKPSPTTSPISEWSGASAREQGDAAITPQWVTDCAATMARTDAEQLALPNSTGELLKLVAICGSTAQRLISEGQFGSVYLPAMMGKDVALALEGHINELPEARRGDAASAVRSFVLAAWQLDAYGDLGNREKLSDAYNLFSAAVAAVTSAYGVQQTKH